MAATNPLYDIIKAIFIDQNAIAELTPKAADDVIFMVHRKLAARYPEHVNAFNIYKINAKAELMYWSTVLKSSRVPDWCYLSGKMKASAKKSKKAISDASLKRYCAAKNMSMRDIEPILRFSPDVLEEEVKMFEEIQKRIESSNGKTDSE